MSDNTVDTDKIFEGVSISELPQTHDTQGEVLFEISQWDALLGRFVSRKLNLVQLTEAIEAGLEVPEFDVDSLQALLNAKGYTVKDTLRILGTNGAVIANAAYNNFLFLFDKRMNNANPGAAAQTAPQRIGEMGRMEAEGYSYWKNAPAVSQQPRMTPVPDSEIRLYDNGAVQFGSLADFIEFGNGDELRVVADGESKTYSLGEMAKTAYERAVDDGFEGTEAEWLESIKVPSFFEQATAHGWEGSEAELFEHIFAVPDVKAPGCVYITDVVPVSTADNVGNKLKTDDGHTLRSCHSSTQHVRVTVEALSGPSSFTPSVTLNDDTSVTMALLDPNGSRFRGTAQFDLSVLGSSPYELRAEHGDGGIAAAVVHMESAPVVTMATFTQTYQNGQTELKAGDTVNVRFMSDVPVVGYEISNVGALTARSGDLAQGTEHFIQDLTVANRGNNTIEHGFRVRVRTATGTWSEWYDSNSVQEKIDGVSFVNLNNTTPTITFGAITYPAAQGALRNNQSAVVNHTVANADAVEYASDNGQLIIASPELYEAAKTVDYLSGSYNISSNNFKVTATRSANGATATRSTVVRIATELPSISITTPATRLRSGGALGTEVQKHTITMNSTHELLEAPSLSAPSGNWEGNWTPNASRTRWTRTLAIHDADAKGDFQFTGLVAMSLSGEEQNAIASGAGYVIGGFVQRRMQVAPYPVRQAAIGTSVVDTAKLRCSNLSKGATNSLNFQYKPTQEAEVNRYTIIGDNNEIWYNCDDPNATSNTSGAMYIDLEELV